MSKSPSPTSRCNPQKRATSNRAPKEGGIQALPSLRRTFLDGIVKYLQHHCVKSRIMKSLVLIHLNNVLHVFVCICDYNQNHADAEGECVLA
eukprot:COSAG02_NODE_8518_length_2539_cov_46.841803_2_plen_92_part_00